MKPRIAFCFSGQARNFQITFPYYQRNLFESAIKQGFEYDIFCAIEDDTDAYKIEQMNPTRIIKIKSSEVEKIIDSSYSRFIKENLNTSFFTHQIQAYKIERGLQQFYKILQSDHLRTEYSKENNISYDIVFRLRFDSAFLETVDFKKILSLVSNDRTILMNKSPSPFHEFYDFFGIGSNKSMSIYSSLFDTIEPTLMEKNGGGKFSLLANMLKPIRNLADWINGIIPNGRPTMILNFILSYFANYMFRNGANIFTYELLLYKHLMRNGLDVVEANIDMVLVRSPLEASNIFLSEQKSLK